MKAMDYAALLGRPEATVDPELPVSLVRGAVVLVTGAGGSIGAELARQVDRIEKSGLVLLDRAEDNLFRIHAELPLATPIIGDVSDRDRMEWLFARYKPDLVIHAAAYKHVPMMELCPDEALRNNAVGTRVLADTAVLFGASRFVLVSTDKAVNPSSVMGATKRLAERYVRALHGRSRTVLVTVRFGNVLGSTGSVVPTFLDQIARGGPVTVTHPEMERYFMTIPEAARLVLAAAALGRGGETFVLDMGRPVKILDLAREVIRRSGVTPEPEVAFIGPRPGEKLREELSREGLRPTAQPGVMVGELPVEALQDVVAAMHRIRAADNVRARLMELC